MINETPISTGIQGAPIANYATIHYRTKKVALVVLDMRSRWCKVGGWGDKEDCPEIYLDATEHSDKLNMLFDRSVMTSVVFAGFPGWKIFGADEHKDYINITLEKP